MLPSAGSDPSGAAGSLQRIRTPGSVIQRSIGGKDRIAVDPPLVINCPSSGIVSWFEKTVQPAAAPRWIADGEATPVPLLPAATSIPLPSRRQPAPLHANAIDLPAFFLANGRIVNLTQGWGHRRRDLVAGLKLVPIVSKTPDGASAGVTTADMKTNEKGGAGEAKVVKAFGRAARRGRSRASAKSRTAARSANPARGEVPPPRAPGAPAMSSPRCSALRPTTCTAPTFISTCKTATRSTSASDGGDDPPPSKQLASSPICPWPASQELRPRPRRLLNLSGSVTRLSEGKQE